MQMRRYAFTLIELLIVVAIIGILAAVAVPNFLNAQMRAKVARVEGDVKTIKDALVMYQLDRQDLPNWITFGWYPAYAQLTTPVAYMSGILQDIFLNKFTDEFPLYQYSFTTAGQSLRQMHDGGMRAGSVADLVIASLGPDGEDDTISIQNYPRTRVKFVPYEPSNGLNSDGDILIETHPGLNPNVP